MLSGNNSYVVSHVQTARNIKHKFKLVFKGAFPEPRKPSSSWPILGESALNFSKLKEGYVKNIQRYWLDETNLSFSPETGQMESLSQENNISPALGPTTEPMLLNTTRGEFKSYLQNITIRTLNEYYRGYAEKVITILATDKYYSNWPSASEQLSSIVGTKVAIMEQIKLFREDEARRPYTERVPLVFPTNPSQPELYTDSTGTVSAEFNYYSKLYDNIGKYLTAVDTLISLQQDEVKELNYNLILSLDKKDELMTNLDVREATQEVFGFPNSTAIERVESTPYIPFRLERRKLDKKHKDAGIYRLPLGRPFILRMFLRSPAPGADRYRIHYDLGERLRLTIDGTSMTIKRKRSEAEITKYFKEIINGMTAEQKAQLSKDYNESLKASTGFGSLPTPLTNIEKAEQMLEAYYLSLLLYNSSTVETPGSYGDAIQSLRSQQNRIEVIKAAMVEIREEYKELTKKRAGRKLLPEEEAEKTKKLNDLRKEMQALRAMSGKNESLRRKIANLEKILYTQSDSVELSNTQILDSPLQIKVVDYGVGMVLFEFNGGKDVHVFRDREILNNNLKIKNKLGGKRSGGTGTNRIQILDKDSYTWTISETTPRGIEIGGKFVISGTGGSFIFAMDDVKVSNGTIFIPVATDTELGVHVGPAVSSAIFSASTTPAETTDITQIPSPIELTQERDYILITNLPAYTNKNPAKTVNVDVSTGVVSSDVGEIKMTVFPGVIPNVTPNPEDVPGYTQWIEFLTKSDSLSGTPDSYTIRNIKPNFRYFMLKVDFIVKEDAERNSLSLPLLFRGAINVLGDSDNWDNPGLKDGEAAPDQDLATRHIIVSGGIGGTYNPSLYTINVEPVFSEEKRRATYQVSITYREKAISHSIKTDSNGKSYSESIPDYMVGKRCDILYLQPEYFGQEDNDSLWIPIVTDGYVTHQEQDDMLAITQPRGNPTTLPIGGFLTYHLTKTTVNVTDSLRLLDDQLVKEGVVLEGYHLYDALSLLLKNGGFPKSKISFNERSMNLGNIGGAYGSSNIHLREKFCPVALPGSTHSFKISTERRRFNAVNEVIERMGQLPSGEISIYVDRYGIIRLAQPFILGSDPRYENSRMVYRSRPHAATLGGDTQLINTYIYFTPLIRRRNFDDFYSSLKVIGPVNSRTGKRKTYGVKKHEVIKHAINNINENHYLGHHRDLEAIEKLDIKSDQELLETLYHKYNIHTYPREQWVFTAPFNPFINPLDVIFIIPDAITYTTQFSHDFSNSGTFYNPNPANPDEWNDIAWKVIDVVGNTLDDEMKITVTPLTKEEKKLLRGML
jgi:hypothetical protein